MSSKIKSKIIQYLSESRGRSSPLIARGDEEINLLKEWLNSADIPAKEVTGEADSIPEQLRKIIESCKECSEISGKKFAFGDGLSGVMVILHSPRLVDRVEKNILKNESVDILKKMLSAINLKMSECYITNMIKCDSDNVFMRPSEMIENCLKILEKEMALIKPRVVIVMGDMQPLQRMVHLSSGILWYTLEHPITLIKNPELKRPAWNTLQTAATEIENLKS